MLRITARHADEWNTWGNVTMAGNRRDGFIAACESVGRDPATMRTSVQAFVMLSDDSSAARSALSSPSGERMIAGNASQLVDEIGRYGELGFDEFIVPDWNLGATPEARRESLERITSDVIDQLA